MVEGMFCSFLRTKKSPPERVYLSVYLAYAGFRFDQSFLPRKQPPAAMKAPAAILPANTGIIFGTVERNASKAIKSIAPTMADTRYRRIDKPATKQRTTAIGSSSEAKNVAMKIVMRFPINGYLAIPSGSL
ncbi:hypothetical protein [Pseudomonas chlororaphis]|uniref:hypothetical protein n=1 Tax=Pseudomonas chlororaphis TaxID=587753 RepID=UPI001B33568C|nr:hypothetical protein [Pseudomonas chlororaphis]MBP5059142.1 hypothetical protein [Pseudomonas chlororaphis]MBP5142689.1 hypothetical protein [Pseudomonas chlororaphis]